MRPTGALLAGVLILCTAWGAARGESRGGRTVVHELTIRHPGKPQPVACVLAEEWDESGTISGYSMEVESVTCADKKCDTVPVRMIWDELGNYLHYELEPGDELTKMDHEVFTQGDYKVLDRIIANRDSPLRWVASDELVPPEKAVQGVDVVSGATALSRKGTVVRGAAYTCYTLWHWANGDASEQIRRLTAANLEDDRMLAFLGGEDRARVIFALEVLTDRKLSDRALADAVVRHVRLGDDVVVRKALRCLERQAGGEYFKALEALFLSAEKKRRVLILQSVVATTAEPPAGFMEKVSAWLPELGSYHEVDLLLKLMESSGASSGKAVERAMVLLEDENFLVARRAYWFLEEQKLTADQRKKLDAFGAKHEDRL